MKKYTLLIVLVCIIIGLIVFVSLDKPKEDTLKKTTPEQVQQAKIDLITKQLSDKYQANVDWDKDIDYTLQLQEKLINGKPTLFEGYIQDIFSSGNKTFIKLVPSFFGFGLNINYIAELDCNNEIINEIKNHDLDSSGWNDNYIVVANVGSINKLALTLSSSTEEVEIENSPSDTFMIKGTCLDISYIGGEENKKELIDGVLDED